MATQEPRRRESFVERPAAKVIAWLAGIIVAGGTVVAVVLPSQPSPPKPLGPSGTTPTTTPTPSVWLSDLSNPTNSNFSQVASQPVTVGGQPFAHTVELQNPQEQDCGNPSFISFPVPSGVTRLSGTYGWTSDNGGSDQLLVYGDSTSGKTLWTHPFTNPGLPLVFKSVNVTGLHQVIFELAGNTCGSVVASTFVLANAQFSP